MEGFYEEIMKIQQGQRVVSSIINAPCKRIYANSFFNKRKFEEWLSDPILENELKISADVTSNGPVDTNDVFIERDLKATEINTNEISVDGELKFKGKRIVEHIYPIGSIYINGNSDRNPKQILGFGSWVSMGRQKVLVGIDPNDDDFNGNLQTGGMKSHLLQEEEIPTHHHNGETDGVSTDPHWHNVRSADFTIYGNSSFFSGSDLVIRRTSSTGLYTSYSDAWHDHDLTIRNAGGNKEHNNVQPYITVYMWRRTS